jgi:tripartite ATP-independent transporter DctM subunit
MTPDTIATIGFVALFVLALLRVPIGVVMGVVGFSGVATMMTFDSALSLLSLRPIGIATDYSLALIPLFVLMGTVAGGSGMSSGLYTAVNAWIGHRKGGVAMSTIVACGGFSAICGSSVATAATMARVALPEMRRFGYPDTLATGTVAAGGTLGILIPPSIILAIYGLITEQDIGRLFIAAIIPGGLAITLYLVTVRLYFVITAVNATTRERAGWSERFRSLHEIWPITMLFAGIISGLYGGVFTPSEAAAMGAVGAIAIAALSRRLSFRRFYACAVESMQVSAGIFLILIGASVFGLFLTLTGVPQSLTALLLSWGLGPYGTLVVILSFLLLLGCVMDGLAMLVLTVPILFPVITALGFDPIWFGIVMVVAVELALITPPVGLNIFVLQALAKDVPLLSIYRGVLPFVAADVVRLIILVAFPGLTLFLPGTMR